MQQGETPYSELPPPTGAPVATTAAPPPPVVADRRVPCPRCAAPTEPGQEVCLRCGALVGRVYRRPPSWRVPAALAALGVLLIGAGAGFGIAELSHEDDGGEPVSLTPDRPRAPVPAPEPPPTTAPPTTATTPEPPTTTEATPTDPPSGGAPADAVLTDWPSGKTGWTVQLATFDDKAKAEDEARKAAAQSISAGVLEGAKYEELGDDQWVVFMGQYDSRGAARMASKGYASKGFRGDVRQITPKK